MAVAVIQDGRAVPADDVTKTWRERIEQARNDRSRYEPNWQQARAFAGGKHWLKWSRRQRRLVLPAVTQGRDRYSVEEIGQYRNAAVGELSHDDNLPTLLFRHGDVESKEFTKEANDALRYALDEEIGADEILMDLKFALVDLGTAALRCYWDPYAGPVVGHLPAGPDGRPTSDQATLAHLEQNGQMPDGSLPRFVPVNEGRIRLELGAPENLLVPPGIEYARDFPWEIWASPVPIQSLIDEYGDVAKSLKEESLSAVQMLGSAELGGYEGDQATDTGQPGKLRDHTLLYRCFERPTRAKPQGELMMLAGSKELLPMSAPGTLRYQAPDQTWRSGVTYFHYQRVPGRFWGRGLVEVLKDPQRMIDKRRTQINETLDRGQPKVFVEKGSIDFGDEKTGKPMEVWELERNAPAPTFHQGTQPGPWMQAEVESCREDMARSSGLQDVALGANPANVTTYSQLALLKEQDAIKRIPLQKRFQGGIVKVIEDVVYDIRSHWGPEKIIDVGGEEDLLESWVFNATKVPTFYKLEVPKGAAKPLSQASWLKLIDDIATYSVQAVMPLPPRWYYDSIIAGKPLPLPNDPTTDQREKAQMENTMLLHGHPAQVDYYDVGAVHVPEHRSLQIQAQLSERHDVAAIVEEHIQQHIAQEMQQQAMAAAAAQPQNRPGTPAKKQPQSIQPPAPAPLAPPYPS